MHRRPLVQIAPAEESPRTWQDACIARARAAVIAQVSGKPMHERSESKAIASAAAKPVFVTIERQGRVVGCRGTLAPRYRTLDEEIVHAARSAAAFDPRYRPLTRDDLRDFLVTVTIIERLEPMEKSAIGSLTPEHGLVLKTTGGKTGVVLPFEGKDPKVRLTWAYRKAGVAENVACNLQRMFAERFRG